MKQELDFVKQALNNQKIDSNKYIIDKFGLGYKSGIGIARLIEDNKDIDTIINIGFVGSCGYNIGDVNFISEVSPLFTEENEGDDYTLNTLNSGVKCITSPKFVLKSDVENNSNIPSKILFDMELLHIAYVVKTASRNIKLYSIKVVSDNLYQDSHGMNLFMEYIQSVENPFDEAIHMAKDLINS